MRETVRLFYPKAELTFLTVATVCTEKRNIKSLGIFILISFVFHRLFVNF